LKTTGERENLPSALAVTKKKGLHAYPAQAPEEREKAILSPEAETIQKDKVPAKDFQKRYGEEKNAKFETLITREEKQKKKCTGAKNCTRQKRRRLPQNAP